MSRVRGFAGRTITFGVSAAATVRAVTVDDRGLAGVRARVATPAGDVVLDSPLLGRGNLSNLLAATAVAVDSGIPLDEIASAASGLRPSARRGEVLRLANGVNVVDDSYNSSPSALASALEVVRNEPRATRKIAVLGEMLELGDHSARLHSDSGRLAAGSNISRLYAIGGAAAQALATAAVDAGMPADAVTYFMSSEEAAPVIAAAVQSGDLVLVKGSRGIRTDVIVDRLAAELA
jgi:UDP-N-acetylmuramoyl-tripeptide--D-alanyl-D-alanine ligase